MQEPRIRNIMISSKHNGEFNKRQIEKYSKNVVENGFLTNAVSVLSQNDIDTNHHTNDSHLLWQFVFLDMGKLCHISVQFLFLNFSMYRKHKNVNISA